MSPQMGVYDRLDALADIAAHAALLDAHNFEELTKLRTGVYLSTSTPSSHSTAGVVANRLYAIPFIAARAMTLDRLAIAVTGAGAGGTKARLGIYKDGTNLYPGTLLLDAGLVNVDAIATVFANIDQALTKGLYWLTLVTDGAPTARNGTFQYSGTSPLGFDASFRFYDGWYVAFAYAALPDPFTAGGSLSNAVPLIAVRIASLD